MSFTATALPDEGAALCHSGCSRGPKRRGDGEGGIKGLFRVPQGSEHSPGEDKKELERTFIDEDVLLVL